MVAVKTHNCDKISEMSEKVIRSKSSPYIKGSIELSTEERMQEILDQVNPGRELAQTDTTDRWGGRDISIEEERENTLTLQKELDEQVAQENLGITPIRKGLPPCKRVKQEG